MKTKATVQAAIGDIREAILAGFELINEDLHLPEPSDSDLPSLAGKILLTLERELAIFQDNEKYEGMTADQIAAAKANEKQTAVAANLAASSLAFAAMLESKEPPEEPEDPEDPENPEDPGEEDPEDPEAP